VEFVRQVVLVTTGESYGCILIAGSGVGVGVWRRRRPMLIVSSHSPTLSIVTESRKSCTALNSYYIREVFML
jgi:hypothetical protein